MVLVSPVITVYDAAKDIASGSVREVSSEALLNFWDLNYVEAFLENEAQDTGKDEEEERNWPCSLPLHGTCHSEAFGGCWAHQIS